MDDLDLKVCDLENRVNEIWNILQATRKRLDDFEVKGKRSGAKAPPTGRKIHLSGVPTVSDGETVQFTGRICWVKDYGKKKSVLIKPLDAHKDDKEAGAFFEWWDETPDWWAEKPVVDCVAQLKINGKYRNFALVKAELHGQPKDNLPGGTGEPHPPDTTRGEYASKVAQVDKPYTPQTFAPDSHGPTGDAIPF